MDSLFATYWAGSHFGKRIDEYFDAEVKFCRACCGTRPAQLFSAAAAGKTEVMQTAEKD
jgi:hypothetical protein